MPTAAMQRCCGPPPASVSLVSSGLGKLRVHQTVHSTPSHLCFSDVRVDNRSAPSAIQVVIKVSKTEPFRQGVTLHIGITGDPLRPVAAVLSYMVARRGSPGPLFTWEDNRYLTRHCFMISLRAALTEAGYVAKDYAGHSFRIGAATTAVEHGIQDSLIKPWAGGRAVHTPGMSELRRRSFGELQKP